VDARDKFTLGPRFARTRVRGHDAQLQRPDFIGRIFGQALRMTVITQIRLFQSKAIMI